MKPVFAPSKSSRINAHRRSSELIKLEPVTVIDVPPLTDPISGEIALTAKGLV
jgi:hypothetical protein